MNVPKFALDGKGPLYRQIRRAVAGPILSGLLAPGTRLPSEHALMGMFNASRMTVNRAFQMLADEGLVVRRRRSGTFVASSVAEHAIMELRDIGEEIESGGASYRYELRQRSVVAADAHLGKSLAVPQGSEVLLLVCRHLSDDRPYVMERRYINLTVVTQAREESFATTPPNRWLLRNLAWSRAEHCIQAIAADEALAAELAIGKRDACLRVERRTWLAESPLTFVSLTYPGEQHRLVGGFSSRD